MKPASLALVALMGLAAAGCANVAMPAPQPSLPTIRALRDGDLPALKVADFSLAPGMSQSSYSSVTIRSVVLSPPGGGDLAAYLQHTLEADLRAGGKLDDKSALGVSGILTKSDVSSAIGTGSGSLAAKFSLRKADKVVFEKDFSVSDQWDSSFIGAEAIPDAMNHYTALYDKLVQKLLTDTDFEAAAKTQ